MQAQLSFFILFRRIFIPRIWPWIALAMAAAMAYAIYASLHALPLVLRGATTTAQQTSLRATSHLCHSDSCGPVRHGQRYWRVTRDYAFTARNGQQVQTRTTERLAHEPVRSTGPSRAVLYMPANPSHHILGGRRVALDRLLISALLTAGVLGALAYLIATSAGRAREGLRVLQQGERRMASVTTVPEGTKGDAARAVWWALPGGRVGHSLPLPKGSERPAYGTRIEVRDDGQASWWVEDLRPDLPPPPSPPTRA